MLRTNFQKFLVAAVALGLLVLGAIAAALVHSSSEKANKIFQAVTILNEMEQHLLRSLTTTISFVQHQEDGHGDLASSVRTELSVFRNIWQSFSKGYSVDYPGISDLFQYPINIDNEVEHFFELGNAILRPSNPAAQHTDYHEMLHIARYKLQDAITVAQQVAQNDYTKVRDQMIKQLQISLVAIVLLLLAGIWIVDRMLVSSAVAKEAAESAARAKSDFLSTMSHEIRTPMSGVIGMAELLERTELTEKQKLYVSTIASSGYALTTIINDLLDMAKINAGKMTVRNHPFNLTALVEDIATLLSPRASEKNTELTVRIEPGLPTHLVGDAGHIRQVILNLAGNAIKFTENGTVLLDISGNAMNGEVRLTISVEDSGIGIPPDRLRKIFNNFEQVEDPDPAGRLSGQKTKGTGLGLAISSKLVDLMGGEIRVSSTQGEGSRFWFTLTLKIDPEADADDNLPSDIAGARILFVDDNAINRTVAVEKLGSWSLAPHAVENEQIALETLADAAENGEPFDLAVLDYQMASMDGLTLAGKIRGDRRTADLPILMLTSIVNSGDEDVFRKNGIDGHLTKPVRASLMLETITDILRSAGYSEKRDTATGAKADTPQLGNVPDAVPERRARRPGPHAEPRQYQRPQDERSNRQDRERR